MQKITDYMLKHMGISKPKKLVANSPNNKTTAIKPADLEMLTIGTHCHNIGR